MSGFYWQIDRDLTFLNHGSFGACPRQVLELQNKYQVLMERDPMKFFMGTYPEKYFDTVEFLKTFLNAKGGEIALIPNTTYGINSVLKSLKFSKGDEMLVTNQEYGATANTLDFVANEKGLNVKTIDVPFPIDSSETVIEKVKNAITSKTKLLLIDHITSPTGLVYPIKEIIRACRDKSVLVVVDGAHGPGQVDIDLKDLDADFYIGNCHKWLCTPKGSALMFVRDQFIETIRPIAISHGHGKGLEGKEKFHFEFMWTGTFDPSAYLSIIETVEFFESEYPGGVRGIAQRNHELICEAQDILAEAIGIEAPAPKEMLGSMVAFPLPEETRPMVKGGLLDLDPLYHELYNEHRIQVFLNPWPELPKRVLRVSAFLYNDIDDYKKLATILKSKFQ